MDEPLTSAYDELVASVSPPPDARQRVSARRAQRRRRRRGSYAAAGGAVACAALIAVLTAGGGGSTVTPAEDPSTTSDTPSPPAMPTEVTCADGNEPGALDYDHPGYGTFTELLAKEAESNGAYTVDRSSGTIYFLREDGTAHTALPWTGDTRSRWFPSSKTWCADYREWLGLSLDVSGPSAPVSLQLGHCWIEPVEFAGRTWDVIKEDQFGSGGRVPSGFTGTGTGWRTGDVVTYVDDGGTRLTLVPDGDPWTMDRIPCR